MSRRNPHRDRSGRALRPSKKGRAAEDAPFLPRNQRRGDGKKGHLKLYSGYR